jgi:hypothetical protein
VSFVESNTSGDPGFQKQTYRYQEAIDIRQVPFTLSNAPFFIQDVYPEDYRNLFDCSLVNESPPGRRRLLQNLASQCDQYQPIDKDASVQNAEETEASIGNLQKRTACSTAFAQNAIENTFQAQREIQEGIQQSSDSVAKLRELNVQVLNARALTQNFIADSAQYIGEIIEAQRTDLVALQAESARFRETIQEAFRQLEYELRLEDFLQRRSFFLERQKFLLDLETSSDAGPSTRVKQVRALYALNGIDQTCNANLMVPPRVIFNDKRRLVFSFLAEPFRVELPTDDPDQPFVSPGFRVRGYVCLSNSKVYWSDIIYNFPGFLPQGQSQYILTEEYSVCNQWDYQRDSSWLPQERLGSYNFSDNIDLARTHTLDIFDELQTISSLYDPQTNRTYDRDTLIEVALIESLGKQGDRIPFRTQSAVGPAFVIELDAYEQDPIVDNGTHLVLDARYEPWRNLTRLLVTSDTYSPTSSPTTSSPTSSPTAPTPLPPPVVTLSPTSPTNAPPTNTPGYDPGACDALKQKICYTTETVEDILDSSGDYNIYMSDIHEASVNECTQNQNWWNDNNCRTKCDQMSVWIFDTYYGRSSTIQPRASNAYNSFYCSDIYARKITGSNSASNITKCTRTFGQLVHALQYEDWGASWDWGDFWDYHYYFTSTSRVYLEVPYNDFRDYCKDSGDTKTIFGIIQEIRIGACSRLSDCRECGSNTGLNTYVNGLKNTINCGPGNYDTTSPTQSPTSSPTSPTLAPTASPSFTQGPSQSPTLSPTITDTIIVFRDNYPQLGSVCTTGNCAVNNFVINQELFEVQALLPPNGDEQRSLQEFFDARFDLYLSIDDNAPLPTLSPLVSFFVYGEMALPMACIEDLVDVMEFQNDVGKFYDLLEPDSEELFEHRFLLGLKPGSENARQQQQVLRDLERRSVVSDAVAWLHFLSPNIINTTRVANGQRIRREFWQAQEQALFLDCDPSQLELLRDHDDYEDELYNDEEEHDHANRPWNIRLKQLRRTRSLIEQQPTQCNVDLNGRDLEFLLSDLPNMSVPLSIQTLDLQVAAPGELERLQDASFDTLLNSTMQTENCTVVLSARWVDWSLDDSSATWDRVRTTYDSSIGALVYLDNAITTSPTLNPTSGNDTLSPTASPTVFVPSGAHPVVVALESWTCVSNPEALSIQGLHETIHGLPSDEQVLESFVVVSSGSMFNEWPVPLNIPVVVMPRLDLFGWVQRVLLAGRVVSPEVPSIAPSVAAVQNDHLYAARTCDDSRSRVFDNHYPRGKASLFHYSESIRVYLNGGVIGGWYPYGGISRTSWFSGMTPILLNTTLLKSNTRFCQPSNEFVVETVSIDSASATRRTLPPVREELDRLLPSTMEDVLTFDSLARFDLDVYDATARQERRDSLLGFLVQLTDNFDEERLQKQQELRQILNESIAYRLASESSLARARQNLNNARSNLSSAQANLQGAQDDLDTLFAQVPFDFSICTDEDSDGVCSFKNAFSSILKWLWVVPLVGFIICLLPFLSPLLNMCGRISNGMKT